MRLLKWSSCSCELVSSYDAIILFQFISSKKVSLLSGTMQFKYFILKKIKLIKKLPLALCDGYPKKLNLNRLFMINIPERFVRV